jgi:xanthine/uracil permease
MKDKKYSLKIAIFNIILFSFMIGAYFGICLGFLTFMPDLTLQQVVLSGIVVVIFSVLPCFGLSIYIKEMLKHYKEIDAKNEEKLGTL